MFGLPEPLDAVIRGVLLGTVSLAFIIVLVRLVGLRSFSKMTSFDFVITLATGSLLASAGTVNHWPSFIQALIAIATLMGLQVALALYRRSRGGASSPMENEPLILMKDGVYREDAMGGSRVSKDDVRAKLRAAGVRRLADVRYVVLETTGDVSIIQGKDGDDVDSDLIENLR
ncbi:YetF domain-containing protein [Fulvimarina sp. MAC3]|uniref:DUF421 domain-containing protein n=1 Tax=Fulvimarina sp. MAC3 TaxID=3148887 RepID=UPI0031FD86F7